MPQFNKKIGYRLCIALVVMLPFVLYLTGHVQISLLQSLNYFLYDLRVKHRAAAPISQPIVILDIDERSLSQLGHWPWSRDKLAQLTDRLFDDYGVNTLGFDMVFAEPDGQSGLALLNNLKQQQILNTSTAADNWLRQAEQRYDTDRLFAQAVQNRNVVLGYVFRHYLAKNDPAKVAALPKATFTSASANQVSDLFPQAVGYLGNLEALVAATDYSGFFDNPLQSSDGVFRRAPLFQAYQGQVYESFALAMFRASQPVSRLKFHMVALQKNIGPLKVKQQLEAMQVAGQRYELDADGAVYIPFQKPRAVFKYVSAVDVLNQTVPLDTLYNALVIVGSSAGGLGDLKATPVAKALPGLEIHANLLAGLIANSFKITPAYMLAVEVILLFLVGGLLALLLAQAGPFMSVLILALMAGFLFAVESWFWYSLNIVMGAAVPLAYLLSVFTVMTVYSFAVERRRKRSLSKVFGQYVPAALVEELDRTGDSVSIAGENRDMTVCFVDIHGFTAIAETLPPGDVSKVLNAFLTPMTRIIHEHRGTIDKYIGDAVMAFWGAPLADEHHARHAMQAVLAMQTKLLELNEQFAAEGWPTIQLGIGLSSGEMNVGNMGSEFRMAYTVVGDTVNLGARLQEQTRRYHADVIVNSNTVEANPEILFRELDLIAIRGRAMPVSIYQPVGFVTELSQQHLMELSKYNIALSAFREQNWALAKSLLTQLASSRPDDPLYAEYLFRISLQQSVPPETGVGSQTNGPSIKNENS